MEIRTNLQPDECLARIEYLLAPGSVAEKVTMNPEFCFPDGSPRMTSQVNGLDFSISMLGRSKYGSVDEICRFRGSISQNPSGGSVITGRFAIISRTIIFFVLLFALAAFPFIISALTRTPVASLGKNVMALWPICIGIFFVGFMSGSINSQRLVSSFLCELLEAQVRKPA